MNISRTQIKKEANNKTYTRGLKLHEQNKVFDIREEENQEEGTFHISADVEGNYESSYHVTLDYDMYSDEFTDYECQCAAFYQIQGMCKHCVAAALEYAVDVKAPAQVELEAFLKQISIQNTSQSPKQAAPKKVATAPEISNLIYAYSIQDKAKYMQPDMTGTVELEPTLHIDYTGWRVDFRIGGENKYVLKDLHSFLNAIERRQKVDYGKKLGFIHEMNVFTKNSQNIIAFITETMDEYNYYKNNMRSYYYQPSMRALELSDKAKGAFLHAMIGKRCKLDDFYSPTKSVFIWPGDPTLKVSLEKQPNEAYQIILPPMEGFYGDKRLYVRQKDVIYECDTEFSKSMQEICKLGSYNGSVALDINEKDMSSFCSTLLPVLQKYTELQIEGDLEQYMPHEAVIKIYLDRANGYIVSKIEAEYGDETYNVLASFKSTDAFRDTEKESKAAYAVQMYFEGANQYHDLYISEENEDAVYKLLTTGISQLAQLGELYISEAFNKLKVTTAPKMSIGVSVAGGLLDLTIDAGRLKPEDLQGFLASYRRRKKYYRLKNGDFMNLEDNSLSVVSELVDGLQLKAGELTSGSVEIPAYRAFYLDQVLKNQGEEMEVFRDHSFKAMIRNIKSIEDSDYEVPGSLKKILRKYQKTGFRWLCTLHNMGFGGILADDMGLGKTLQIIAFLLYHKQVQENKDDKNNQDSQENRENKVDKKTSLIICPASLVYNWQSEIEKFAPELSSLVLAGTLSERQNEIEDYNNYDVVITSYDLLKRDIELYTDKVFYAEIIDEAQNIKNHITQSSKAVKLVKAITKFALTGTPIENRLSELWSIFDYLMPGFLGGYKSFKSDFETPIAANKDEIMTKRLQKMIKPFILRRIKSDVLKELPEKEENIIYSKLEGEQLALYSANVQKMLDNLGKKSKEEFTNNKLQILAELTRLRQICCAPAMLYENYQGESAKLDTCMELLRNAIESGHKVLVFSQFTSLFTLLEVELKHEKMSYYKLTGATSKIRRAQMVEEFNENEVSIFLISLKAGGTGLNLTGASIVIHFDPWWNVAAQNQATDRAHRIGQKSTVSVFKLIAKNTIEEKILKMQEAKKDLSDQIISGEGVSVANLTQEDFIGILES